MQIQCPENMQHSGKGSNDDYEDYNKPQDTMTEKSLVKLHKRVIQASQSHHRTQAQWNNLLQKAYLLEDIVANEGKQDRHFKHSVSQPNTNRFYTPTMGTFLAYLYSEGEVMGSHFVCLSIYHG